MADQTQSTGDDSNNYTTNQYSQSTGGEITSSIDPDTTIFMNTITIPNDSTVFYAATAYEITGAELWTATDRYVKNLKGTGDLNSTTDFWSDILQITPIIGGDATRHAVNLRSPGTKDLIFAGTWVHSGSGAKPNGSTGYADTQVSPSELSGTGVNFGRYNGTLKSAGATTQMGAWNGSSGWFIHNASNVSNYTLGGIASQYQAPDFHSAGLQSVNGLSGVTRGSRRGYRVSSASQTAITTITANITHNCMQHNNGTRSLFSPSELRLGYFITRSLSEAEMVTFNAITEAFQQDLHRQYVANRAFFWGDSTTAGAGVSLISRWASLISNNKTWTQINRGLDGTTLMSASPINRIASPNMYDIRNTDIPTYDSTQDSAIFISYSINDCGLFFPNYTVETWETQLAEIIDVCIAKGWPTTNIVLVIGLYCDESLNCWDFYSGLGGGSFPPIGTADNVRHVELIDAAEAVAITKGVVWASPYQAMIDTPTTYVSNDGRHPVASPGHDTVSTYVLTQITGIT